MDKSTKTTTSGFTQHHELGLRSIAFALFTVGAIVAAMKNADAMFIISCIGCCLSLMRYAR